MDPQYYIQAGVRRAFAALAAGRTDISATVYVGGKAGHTIRVRLDQLHSPKATILRDSRYIVRTEYPTAILKTEPPAIEVEPLGAPYQTASIPLARVRLV